MRPTIRPAPTAGGSAGVGAATTRGILRSLRGRPRRAHDGNHIPGRRQEEEREHSATIVSTRQAYACPVRARQPIGARPPAPVPTRLVHQASRAADRQLSPRRRPSSPPSAPTLAAASSPSFGQPRERRASSCDEPPGPAVRQLAPKCHNLFGALARLRGLRPRRQGPSTTRAQGDGACSPDRRRPGSSAPGSSALRHPAHLAPSGTAGDTGTRQPSHFRHRGGTDRVVTLCHAERMHFAPAVDSRLIRRIGRIRDLSCSAAVWRAVRRRARAADVDTPCYETVREARARRARETCPDHRRVADRPRAPDEADTATPGGHRTHLPPASRAEPSLDALGGRPLALKGGRRPQAPSKTQPGPASQFTRQRGRSRRARAAPSGRRRPGAGRA